MCRPIVKINEGFGRKVGLAPVIGVTASLKEDEHDLDTRPLGRFIRADLDYVEGVAEAGGVPVVLPPIAGIRAAEALVDGIDGLLLSGGSDLHPEYYGEEPMPELNVTIPERDEFEMAVVGCALRRGLPIFGICRGMQLLNVALGGTLYQDIPAQLGRETLKHRQETPKWQPTHEIEVHKASVVAEITGRYAVKVNSYHHQAIKDLAEGLVISARSADGVIEAVEYRELSERWVVGVQWHAEAMRGVGHEHRAFFSAHVEAAERHALRRAAA